MGYNMQTLFGILLLIGIFWLFLKILDRPDTGANYDRGEGDRKP